LTTLEELKNIIQENLKKELKIMEMILSLSENDAQEFKDWYIKQPIVKGIDEIYGLVGSRTMGYTKTKEHNNNISRQ
jgi:glutamyl-tRNA reductase